MSRIAYVNGRFLPLSAAMVSVEDRGFQFADGVYEVIYLKDGRLIDAELHLARLSRSLAAIGMAPPMSQAALLCLMAELIRRNRLSDGLLYLQITRGAAPREHAFPRPLPKPTMVMTLRRAPAFPKDLNAWAAAAITYPDQRWARCDIKTVGLLPNVLAKQAARERGAQEAILIDANGMVTEGASSTVWIVDAAGRLCTRTLDHAVLPGCTREAVAALLARQGIAWTERPFSLAEMQAAREVFLTSATSFVRPITAIDENPVGNGQVGELTRKVFDVFARHVAEEAAATPAGKAA